MKSENAQLRAELDEYSKSAMFKDDEYQYKVDQLQKTNSMLMYEKEQLGETESIQIKSLKRELEISESKIVRLTSQLESQNLDLMNENIDLEKKLKANDDYFQKVHTNFDKERVSFRNEVQALKKQIETEQKIREHECNEWKQQLAKLEKEYLNR